MTERIFVAESSPSQRNQIPLAFSVMTAPQERATALIRAALASEKYKNRQKELAAELDLSPGALSKWKTHGVSLEGVERVKRWSGRSDAFFFGELTPAELLPPAPPTESRVVTETAVENGAPGRLVPVTGPTGEGPPPMTEQERMLLRIATELSVGNVAFRTDLVNWIQRRLGLVEARDDAVGGSP